MSIRHTAYFVSDAGTDIAIEVPAGGLTFSSTAPRVLLDLGPIFIQVAAANLWLHGFMPGRKLE